MKKSELLRAKKLGQFANQLFEKTAEAMYEETSAEGRFSALAKQFQHLQPKLSKLDPRARAALTDMMAGGAKAVATLLPRLRKGISKEIKLTQAVDLVAALEQLSDAILLGANSASAPPVKRASSSARRAAFVKRIGDIQDRAGDLAFQFHLIAASLRSIIGLELPASRQAFQFPSLNGCGCDKFLVDDTAPRTRGTKKSGRRLTGKSLPKKEFAVQLGEIERLSLLLPPFLNELALVFTLPLAFLNPCADLCTPAPSLITCAFGAVNSVDNGTNWVPTFTIVWTLCCTCSCCLISTQNKAVPVPKTYTVGGAPIPNTRPRGKQIADGIAATAGRAEVTKFNASLVPAPPPPPPFVPNPAITPLVAPPACPKC